MRIRSARPFSLALMLGLFAITPMPSAEAANCNKAKVADQVGKAFFNAARSGSTPAFARALRRHADMRRISLFALGPHRKKLSTGQQQQFVTLTTTYISSRLSDYSRKFHGTDISVAGCQGNGTVISTISQAGGRQKKVIWRFSGNRVVDVNVQNVWLAQLLRSNYTSIINRNGGNVNALIVKLRGR